MNDLISRQAAIEAFEKELSLGDREFAVSFVGAKRILEGVPSARSERKIGKWTPEYHCSECGFEIDDVLVKYCPWCGARMVDEP